jgi:hypothetical protein
MAEYGIVMKLPKIKGPVQLAGDYKETIPVHNVSYASGSQRTHTGGGAKKTTISVQQADFSMVIPDGPWTAELLDAIYTPKALGDVLVYQLAQSIDTQSKAAPTLLQKLTLTNAALTGVAITWGSDNPEIHIAMTCTKVLYNLDTKSADFILHMTTQDAI